MSKNDAQEALDKLFHYHGFTSWNVSGDKKHEVWKALKIIRQAITQPIVTTSATTINAELECILADIQTAQYKLADMKITAAGVKMEASRLKLEKLLKEIENGTLE